MSIFRDAIASRRSRRSYQDRPLSPEDRSALEEALASPPPAPFGSSIRLALLDAPRYDRQKGIRLGTYGVIKGARSFLAGSAPRGPFAICPKTWRHTSSGA